MIKVSVIVPVYNEESFISQCIETIINQTLKEIEIIFVDNGSTDRTIDIINNYKKSDNRIKLFSCGKRGGGAARNVGLEAATGEYLSFLDADDFFEKDMLEKSYKKSLRTKADITIFKVHFYHQATGAVTDEEAGLISEFLPEKEVFSYKDMPSRIFNTFHNWAWNKLFRREFIINNRIKFQELCRTNDLLFTNKALMLAKRITVIKDRLIFYRVRVSGNCQSSNEESPFDFYEAFKALKEFLISNNLFEEVKLSFINHALDGCIVNLNTLEFGKMHEKCFNKLKKEIFDSLDIQEKYLFDYIQEKQIFKQYKCIKENNYKEYVLNRAGLFKDLYREQLFETYRADHKNDNYFLYKFEANARVWIKALLGRK